MFLADHPEVPFSYAVSLYQDAQGGAPDGDDAFAYWEDLNEPEFPVTSSIDQDIRQVLGNVGLGLPTAANVVVSPEMEILAIVNGHGTDEWAFELILEHLSAQD